MKRRIGAMLAAAAGLPAATHAAMAQNAQDFERFGYGRHMMWWGNGWSGMVFGPLMMIVYLAILVAIVLLLVRWLGPSVGGGHHQTGRARAIDILRERFAKGEIDKEEFEERRRFLDQ